MVSVIINSNLYSTIWYNKAISSYDSTVKTPLKKKKVAKNKKG